MNPSAFNTKNKIILALTNLTQLKNWESDTWGVTVVNPLQQELVDAAATTAGYALTYAYNWKVSTPGVGLGLPARGRVLCSFLCQWRLWEAGMRLLSSI